MKNFFLIISLSLIIHSCDDNPNVESYSFFIAGHTYGKPGMDIVRNGLHPPFKNKFELIKENHSIQFGIFLGDIVWESNEESWNNVDNDIIEIGKPIFFAAGNHDIENRTLFESRYGQTYYNFIFNSDLFIVLDPNIDNWNISGDQLVFLKNVLANNSQSVDNIFVFFHQLLWWSNDNIYQNLMLNSYQGREESINFWTEVEPLFSTLPNNIVMMAGDLGAGNWAHSYMYHNYKNITFIGTGMGECQSSECFGNDTGIGNDNFVIINIDENKVPNYELIAINRNNINELGQLEDYVLP